MEPYLEIVSVHIQSSYDEVTVDEGGAKSNDGYPLRRGKFGHRDTCPRRTPRDDRGRDWSCIYKSKTPRNASDETRRGPPLEPSERARPCGHLDSGCPASRTATEQISVVLSHWFIAFCDSCPRQLTYPERFGALCISPPRVKLLASSNSDQGPF